MDTMNSLERVLTALDRKEPDRVPVFEWSINEHVRETLFPDQSEDFDFAEAADMDGVVVYEDMKKEWISRDRYRDEWGVTMAVTEEDYPTSVDHPIDDPEKLNDYTPPDPKAPYRLDSLKEAVNRFKGKKAILFRLRDGFSIPRNLRGMQNIMMDYALNPEVVRRLVDITTDYYITLAHLAMEIGADVFWSSDDYCDNRGPMMGPEPWRSFVLPGLQKVVGAIRREGYHFIKHNDGNINSILEEMVDTDISCIDPIDAEAGMSLKGVKELYGDRVAVKGGVPIGPALSRGAPEDAAAATARCILEGGAGGGYICSSSSDIIRSVQPENFKALLDTVKELGSYPLQEDALRTKAGI
jgi:uroporphyrinogen decarboxylase